MARSKTIAVTANVQKCLKALKEAVQALPAGDLKKRAQRALGYLERTFKGEKQPFRGAMCPVNKLIIK